MTDDDFAELEALLARMRKHSSDHTCREWSMSCELIDEAAAAIRALMAENESLRNSVREMLPTFDPRFRYPGWEYGNALSVADRALGALNHRSTTDAWQPIESAPKDGTVLTLFARASNATASAVVFGWYSPELGWIELCFAPNRPVGIVPSHWKPRHQPPEQS